MYQSKDHSDSKMICPMHNIQLALQQTRYGILYRCPNYDECTVLSWGNETSTPADALTRQARHEAHKIFDALWRSKGTKVRNNFYRELANFLGLPLKETHIGYFDISTCEKVKEFCKINNGTSILKI